METSPTNLRPTNLHSLAASIQDWFRTHGYLPAVQTVSRGLEADRTAVIHRFGLDDPLLLPLIDRCARIANVAFKAPILVTLIEADTQFVLAAVQCKFRPREPLPYYKSLCSHTALRTDGTMLEITDTQKDWRFKNIPNVPRSYAGQPLLLPVGDGGSLVPVGSFCVLGDKPRAPMTPEERGCLADLTHLLTTEIQRVFHEKRQRKETLRRNFVSDLIADLSSFHSTVSPPVDPPAGAEYQKPKNPESEFRMLSATADVRRMLDSDFACLVDLSPLHLSWSLKPPNRGTVSRTVSRSKHGWVGQDRRGTSSASAVNGASQGFPGLRIIDYSCSDACRDYSPVAVVNAPRAMDPLITFLRTYTETSRSGYAHSGTDGVLQSLLPPDSQAHIAIPLFNNAQPTLLFLVSTRKPLHVYEPPDVSFASTFAVLCLGSLAKIKLIKADAAKTAFVSMISHELRTPLHGLLSQLELIREFAPKEFIAETDVFLRTAEVCGLTLRDVLNDVLDFGKQEHGGGEIHAHNTEADLGVLAIEAMSVAYGRRRQWESVTGESESAVEVHVAIEDSPTGWGAMIDVGGLRRVLLNLASNALKYTPKGSIVLSLREIERPAVQPPDGQRLIEFSMQDTGIGMSSEYKKDIFTPFSQENVFNPGSGLGMSISEAILARMGGEIDICSELGKGTTVTFTLLVDSTRHQPPRTATDAPRTVTKTLISGDDCTLLERGAVPSPPQTPTPPCHRSPEIGAIPTPCAPAGGPKSLANGLTPETLLTPTDATADIRVLVVDDNKIGRRILTTLLSRKGVPFREASDGLEALAVYRDFLPHLVWTDVSMPVMDGIESARQMRMIEKELQIRPARIVALTGLSSHGEMKEGLLGEAALDEWLVKGQANLKTLTSGLEKVQRALRRRGSSVSSTSSAAPAA
ncbi:hypothetical protein DFH07DRAFT_408610 [Mycena maculata]|uniref:histidine kinase n=1 Tax=Mycena maculata TaxID=230809 RepID=A0AAD7JF27_9AGAR|nr:hypothetical protein DFH07DRAFT_408610 [Mycena maculata]